MTAGRVLSVGSVNVDYSMQVQTIVRPGETLLARDLHISAGGKSLNQAVAARLLGGDVELVGITGADEAGERIRRDLQGFGVISHRLERSETEPTGQAFIAVDDDGENAITVVSGANQSLEPSEQIRGAVTEAQVLLLALEIPVATVEACIEHAAATGARAVVNVSPYQRLADEVLKKAFLIVVNEHELGELLKDSGARPDADDWAAVAAALGRRGIERTIVTLGANGAAVIDGRSVTHIPAVPIHAVDTTGSGDAFAGAVAYGLASGSDVLAAARLGAQVGAYTATRRGACSSYPTADELRRWMNDVPATVASDWADPDDAAADVATTCR